MSRCGNDRRPGCGKEIQWGVTPDGKRIPLDPSAPVYRIVSRAEDGSLTIERDQESMVSHFKTCPKASEFSGSR
jgi:hypothetical protein